MTFHDLARSTVTAVQKKFACGGARTDIKIYTTCTRRDEIELEVAVVRESPNYQYGEKRT